MTVNMAPKIEMDAPLTDMGQLYLTAKGAFMARLPLTSLDAFIKALLYLRKRLLRNFFFPKATLLV